MTTDTATRANECPFCVTLTTQRILCNRHTVALFVRDNPGAGNRLASGHRTLAF